ncbi:helix-turn-helix domain-containing protein [Mycolicibacterium arenosum]|uniref:helix-turn-helix domain-containing protein n=1 Tax=Mycolicibacterium arenosum TaxID=2952157 RepID=UPI0038CD19DE
MRGWRLLRDRSQSRAAAECGVSTAHLTYVETGRAQPRSELILQLASAMAYIDAGPQ